MLDKKYGFAPLHYAADGGHKEIEELLLAKGEDVNQSGQRQLSFPGSDN